MKMVLKKKQHTKEKKEKKRRKRTNHFSINALHTKTLSEFNAKKKGSNNIQAYVYSSVSHLFLARSLSIYLYYTICASTHHTTNSSSQIEFDFLSPL